MNVELIHSKLASLRRCIRRIEEKKPGDAESLSTDLDTQDIIVLNLERAVQQCVDISTHVLVSRGMRAPSSMSAGFSDLASAGILNVDLAGRLSRAVGFRNIAVHEYQEIDVQILFSIISRHLDDFREFARCVVAVVE